MKKLLILVALVFCGCAHPKYQRAGANGLHKTGYSETRISKNMYRVKYLDSESEMAYMNFLRRSAELSLENGFNFFEIKDAGSLRTSGNKMIYANALMDMSLPQYEATIILHAEKENGRFDAKEILQTNPIPKNAKR